MIPILLVISMLLVSSTNYSFKLQRVILSADDNPTYIQFWPVTSLMWYKVVGVKPTLALIAKSSANLPQGVGEVIRFKPIDGIPTGFQAQVIRLLLPALFPEDVCIISDIDMFPLQKKYFTESVQHIPYNKFVVYRDKGYGPAATQYPMCYVAAQGKLFAEIFNITSKKDIKRTIRDWYANGHGWITDEYMMYKYLHEWPLFKTHCVLLGHSCGPRVDRSGWGYDRELLRADHYVDAHLLRPYKKHKKEIDQLMRDRLKK